MQRLKVGVELIAILCSFQQKLFCETDAGADAEGDFNFEKKNLKEKDN